VPTMRQREHALQRPATHIRDRPIGGGDRAALGGHVDRTEVLAGDLHGQAAGGRAAAARRLASTSALMGVGSYRLRPAANIRLSNSAAR